MLHQAAHKAALYPCSTTQFSLLRLLLCCTAWLITTCAWLASSKGPIDIEPRFSLSARLALSLA